MFAPPGVDTDSSGEEITPPPSPVPTPIRPHFSFRALFSSTRHPPSTKHGLVSKSRHRRTEEIQHSTPIEAAEADPKLETDLPTPKKRVRIFAGELEEGKKADGLTDNQGVDVSVSEPTTPLLSPDIPVKGELTTTFPPLEPTATQDRRSYIATDGIAEEVLTMLRRLMAENKNTPPDDPLPGLEVSFAPDPGSDSAPTPTTQEEREASTAATAARPRTDSPPLGSGKFDKVRADADKPVQKLRKSRSFSFSRKKDKDKEKQKDGGEKSRLFRALTSLSRERLVAEPTVKEKGKIPPVPPLPLTARPTKAATSWSSTPNLQSQETLPHTAPAAGACTFALPPHYLDPQGHLLPCSPPGFAPHAYHPASPDSVTTSFTPSKRPPEAEVEREAMAETTAAGQVKADTSFIEEATPFKPVREMDDKKTAITFGTRKRDECDTLAVNEEKEQGMPHIRPSPQKEVKKQNISGVESCKGELGDTDELRATTRARKEDKQDTDGEKTKSKAKRKESSKEASGQTREGNLQPGSRQDLSSRPSSRTQPRSTSELSKLVEHYRTLHADALNRPKVQEFSAEESRAWKDGLKRAERKLRDAERELDDARARKGEGEVYAGIVKEDEVQGETGECVERSGEAKVDDEKVEPKSKSLVAKSEAVPKGNPGSKSELDVGPPLNTTASQSNEQMTGAKGENEGTASTKVHDESGGGKAADKSTKQQVPKTSQPNSASAHKAENPKPSSSSDARRAELENQLKKYKLRYAETKKAYSDRSLSDGRKKEIKEGLKTIEGKIKEVMRALEETTRALSDEGKARDEDSREAKTEEKKRGRDAKRSMRQTEYPKVTEQYTKSDSRVSEKEEKQPNGSPADMIEKEQTPANNESRRKVRELEALVKKYQARYDDSVRAYKKGGLSGDEKAEAKEKVKRAESRVKEAKQALNKARADASHEEVKEGTTTELTVEPETKDIDGNGNAIPAKGNREIRDEIKVGIEDEPEKPDKSNGQGRESGDTDPSPKGPKTDQNPMPSSKDAATTQPGQKADTSTQTPASNKVRELETLVKEYKARYMNALAAYKKEGSTVQDKDVARGRVGRAEGRLKEATQALEDARKESLGEGAERPAVPTEQEVRIQGADGQTSGVVTSEEQKVGSRPKLEAEASPGETQKSDENVGARRAATVKKEAGHFGKTNNELKEELKKCKLRHSEAVKVYKKEELGEDERTKAKEVLKRVEVKLRDLTKAYERSGASRSEQADAQQTKERAQHDQYIAGDITEADQTSHAQGRPSPDLPKATGQEGNTSSHGSGDAEAKRGVDRAESLKKEMAKLKIRYSEAVKTYKELKSPEDRTKAKERVKVYERKLNDATRALQSFAPGTTDAGVKDQPAGEGHPGGTDVSGDVAVEGKEKAGEKAQPPSNVEVREKGKGSTFNEKAKLQHEYKLLKSKLGQLMRPQNTNNLADDEKSAIKARITKYEQQLGALRKQLERERPRSDSKAASGSGLGLDEKREIDGAVFYTTGHSQKATGVSDAARGVGGNGQAEGNDEPHERDIENKTGKEQTVKADKGADAGRASALTVKPDQDTTGEGLMKTADHPGAETMEGGEGPKDEPSTTDKADSTPAAPKATAPEKVSGTEHQASPTEDQLIAQLKDRYASMTRVLRSTELTAHEREKLLRQAERTKDHLKSLSSPPQLTPIVSPDATTGEGRDSPRKVVDTERLLRHAQEKYSFLRRGAKEEGLDEEERTKRSAKLKKQGEVVKKLLREVESEESAHTVKTSTDGKRRDEPLRESTIKPEPKDRAGPTSKPEGNDKSEKPDRVSPPSMTRSKAPPRSGGVTPDQVRGAIHKAAKERGVETTSGPSSPALQVKSLLPPVPKVPGAEVGLKASEEKPVEVASETVEPSAWAPLKPAKSKEKRGSPSLSGPVASLMKRPSPSPSSRPIAPPKSPARGSPAPRSLSRDRKANDTYQAKEREEEDMSDCRNGRGEETEHAAGISGSKTLVALANCIDLANTLLTSLSSCSQTSESPLVRVVQHLMVGLMMQRDLLNSLREVLGDQAPLLDEFGTNLHVIRRYIEGLVERSRWGDDEVKDGEKVVRESHRVVESVSVQSVVSYVMTFTEYLTPGMIATIREVVEEWRKEGMSMGSVVFTILAIRKEMVVIYKTQSHTEQSESRARTEKLIAILDRILAFVSPQHHRSLSSLDTTDSRHSLTLPATPPESASKPPRSSKGDGHDVSSPLFRPAPAITNATLAVKGSPITSEVRNDVEREKREKMEDTLLQLNRGLPLPTVPSHPIYDATPSPNELQGSISEPVLSAKLYPAGHPHALERDPTMARSKSIPRSGRSAERRSHIPTEEPPSSLAHLMSRITHKLRRRSSHETSVERPLAPEEGEVIEFPSLPKMKERRRPIMAHSLARDTSGMVDAYGGSGAGMELRLPRTTQDFLDGAIWEGRNGRPAEAGHSLNRNSSWEQGLNAALTDTPRPDTAPLPPRRSSRRPERTRKTEDQKGDESWKLRPGGDKGSTLVIPPQSLLVHKSTSPPDPGSAPSQILYPHQRERDHRAPKHLPPAHTPTRAGHRPPTPAYDEGEESSPSRYSVGTDSTVESDEDARRLLAVADSGPRTVRHDWGDTLDEEGEKEKERPREPSEGEIKRAEQVLYFKNIAGPSKRPK